MSHARRRTALIVVLLLIALLILALLGRCSRKPASEPLPNAPSREGSGPSARDRKSQDPAPTVAEVLTPAKLTCVAQIPAGMPFSVQWEGPNNKEDYITVVAPNAPASAYSNYVMTSQRNPSQVTAPIEPGRYEVRYVTGQSKTVLGRTPLEVIPAAVSLTAPDHAPAGSEISVGWVGPNNPGDYLAVAAKGAPDKASGNYAYTHNGSPAKVRLPPEPGEAELRYQAGQGERVLARRPILIDVPSVTLNAPDRAIAGSVVSIEWSGPKSPGDYVTIVPRELPDGRYENNSTVSNESAVKVLAPIVPGPCEIRFMSGQGARVFARRPIEIVAAPVTLSAPETAVAGSEVQVAWTGPKNGGDYITIVPKSLPDGRFGQYSTVGSSPTVKVLAPLEDGPAEIRYMSGQGGRVLGRRALTLSPIHITIEAPAEAPAGAPVSIVWTGPNNPGDYLTIVPAGARDGAYEQSNYTTHGSPAVVKAPANVGPAEIRYMSGQGGKVLGRRTLTLVK